MDCACNAMLSYMLSLCASMPELTLAQGARQQSNLSAALPAVSTCATSFDSFDPFGLHVAQEADGSAVAIEDEGPALQGLFRANMCATCDWLTAGVTRR